MGAEYHKMRAKATASARPAEARVRRYDCCKAAVRAQPPTRSGIFETAEEKEK